jgi:hypothetical protein
MKLQGIAFRSLYATRYQRVTQHKVYPGRSHFTMIQDGWEQVADYALTWAVEHATSEPVAQGVPDRPTVASGGGA